MTSDDIPEGVVGDVRAARKLLRRSRDRLLEAIDSLELRTGLDERAKSLNQIVLLYEKAAQQAVDAERRFAKHSNNVHSLGSSGLDLDSAKRDVLERLARIAAARDN